MLMKGILNPYVLCMTFWQKDNFLTSNAYQNLQLYGKLHNPYDTKPQKEEQDKTTFIWKEPKLAANLGGLGSYHHLSTTPKAMNFSLNSDV